ncbi:MAG: DUF4367 domain-containing protein [Anaerolineae bacterium]|nr:DUF4367 domain-containing protein [Anaerolineae bacterium]
MEQTTTRTWRRLAMTTATLIAVFTLSLAVSPQARAFVGDLIQVIGGVSFEQVDALPHNDSPLETVPSLFMTVEEAQATYGFALPTYLPDGFTRIPVYAADGSNGEVIIVPSAEEQAAISLVWERADDMSYTMLHLSIYIGDDSIGLLGQEVEVDEVDIDGIPGASYCGVWRDGQFICDGINHLEWIQEEMRYHLSSTLSLNELIAVAASMR